MPRLSCIVIEDEPLAVKVLADYISEVPFLELKGTFKDAIVAADFIRNNDVDLMFLDIHLPKLKGMTFLKTLTNPPAVIVTTAYHQYAVEGFNLNVTDYLLKPFDFERFLVAVNKVRTVHKKSDEDHEVKSFIFLNVQKKKVKIMFSDIVYIESQREYVKVVTPKGEYVSKISTHEVEEMLPSNAFMRIHRSFIISLNKIDSYTAEAVEVNGVSIPVGRGYRDLLEKL